MPRMSCPGSSQRQHNNSTKNGTKPFSNCEVNSAVRVPCPGSVPGFDDVFLSCTCVSAHVVTPRRFLTRFCAFSELWFHLSSRLFSKSVTSPCRRPPTTTKPRNDVCFDQLLSPERFGHHLAYTCPVTRVNVKRKRVRCQHDVHVCITDRNLARN